MPYFLNIPIEILNLITASLSNEDLFSLLQSNISLASWLTHSATPLRYISGLEPPAETFTGISILGALNDPCPDRPTGEPIVPSSPSSRTAPSGPIALSTVTTTTLTESTKPEPTAPQTLPPCYTDRNLLHHAVEHANDSPDTIYYLLKTTPAVDLLDFADSHGLTPLHLAASSSPAVCAALLEAGAQINAQNYAGETPLFIAVESGRPDIVRTLLSYDADITVVEKVTGLTALQKAVTFGQEEVVSCLLVEAADGEGHQAGVFDGCGETYAPLAEATSAGFVEAVRVMMQVGINPFELNQSGRGEGVGSCSAAAVAVISCWRNGGIRVECSESEYWSDEDDEYDDGSEYASDSECRSDVDDWDTEIAGVKRRMGEGEKGDEGDEGRGGKRARLEEEWPFRNGS